MVFRKRPPKLRSTTAIKTEAIVALTGPGIITQDVPLNRIAAGAGEPIGPQLSGTDSRDPEAPIKVVLTVTDLSQKPLYLTQASLVYVGDGILNVIAEPGSDLNDPGEARTPGRSSSTPRRASPYANRRGGVSPLQRQPR